MKHIGEPDPRAFARLVEYASGTLDEREEDEVAGHLQRCPACRAELAWIEPTLESLRSGSYPEGEAPGAAPSVQPWKAWTDAGARPSEVLRRAYAGGWESTAIEGIEVRALAVDRGRDRATMLVRMAAGARYPPHRHGGPEEMYVLEGDLQVGDLPLGAGDFHRHETGSVHAVQATERGCVLLLQTSLQDELLEEPLD